MKVNPTLVAGGASCLVIGFGGWWWHSEFNVSWLASVSIVLTLFCVALVMFAFGYHFGQKHGFKEARDHYEAIIRQNKI